MDIDLFTTPTRTHDGIQTLLKDNPGIVRKLKAKTVFVLPAFDHMEIIPDSQLSADHWSFPTNKNEVTKLYEDGVMPQFRLHQYEKGHRSTNYSKWIGNNTKASYPIKYEYGYEPYVIGAKKNIPRFYDFSRGYG
mmetsp:Transcript_12881/g.15112  ORF Transcript_12881/g.15112 Transcript_12881/m.15112 type:complete len:135 (-) Transcript_12881:132-536(-)